MKEFSEKILRKRDLDERVKDVNYNEKLNSIFNYTYFTSLFHYVAKYSVKFKNISMTPSYILSPPSLIRVDDVTF